MKMKRIASLLLAMILVASTTTALAASGTLRYNEAIELADVLGYDIIWQKRGGEYRR